MSFNNFDEIDFSELAQGHLETLVALKVSGDDRIEFKRELNMSSDSDKKELHKDIGAIANSAGGYVLFGVEEKHGVASALPGSLWQLLASGTTRASVLIKSA